jgi:hypothetical protein
MFGSEKVFGPGWGLLSIVTIVFCISGSIGASYAHDGKLINLRKGGTCGA